MSETLRRGQKATMWSVGALLGLGFLGDAIEYFVFEKPTEIDVMVELGWVSVFLLTVAVIEGGLWMGLKRYNAHRAKA